ncbi:MAG: hypothetical protein ACHQK8_03980 [Bacteroidia bacterium]
MNRIFSSKFFFWVPVIFTGILFFTVRNDPFFGDAISSTSRATINIYDHHLLSFFYPVEHDPGHPTLYAWLLALCWTILGKSLIVSHAYSIAWFVFLFFIFSKIASLFLPGSSERNKTMLLFFAMPTALSMGAMMLNTTALIALFLGSFYYILTKNKKGFILSASLMTLVHLQAPLLLLAIFFADLFLSRKEISVTQFIRNKFLSYSIPVAIFCIWLLVHYRHTGWLTSSPNYPDRGDLNSISEIFKCWLMIIWRLIDYGMLPFYLVFGFALLKKLGDRPLRISWLILIGVFGFSLSVMMLSHYIAHRYLLGISLLTIIFVMNVLQYFQPKQKNILYLILLISLVAGNFIFYPGKTIGDTTLAYRNYFKLEKELLKDFPDTVIFFSKAPVAISSEISQLNKSKTEIKRITTEKLDELPAIIQSNVSAEFSEADKKLLTENFYGKSYESGAVYINVFLNPKFYEKPEGWKLREPSQIENLLLELKNKVRN